MSRGSRGAENSEQYRLVCHESLATPLILLLGERGAVEHLNASRLQAMIVAIRGLETEVLALKQAAATRADAPPSNASADARIDRLEATLQTILATLRAPENS